MTVTWKQFESMLNSARTDLQRLQKLVEENSPSNRDEFERISKRIFDETSKMLESTGAYTPPIADPILREKWKEMKEEASTIRKWLLQNKGRLLPQ